MARWDIQLHKYTLLLIGWIGFWLIKWKGKLHAKLTKYMKNLIQMYVESVWSWSGCHLSLVRRDWIERTCACSSIHHFQKTKFNILTQSHKKQRKIQVKNIYVALSDPVSMKLSHIKEQSSCDWETTVWQNVARETGFHTQNICHHAWKSLRATL